MGASNRQASTLAGPLIQQPSINPKEKIECHVQTAETALPARNQTALFSSKRAMKIAARNCGNATIAGTQSAISAHFENQIILTEPIFCG
jgi:hypothetical protein